MTLTTRKTLGCRRQREGQGESLGSVFDDKARERMSRHHGSTVSEDLKRDTFKRESAGAMLKYASGTVRTRTHDTPWGRGRVGSKAHFGVTGYRHGGNVERGHADDEWAERVTRETPCRAKRRETEGRWQHRTESPTRQIPGAWVV